VAGDVVWVWVIGRVVVEHNDAAGTHQRRKLLRIAGRAFGSAVAEQEVEWAPTKSQLPVSRRHLDRIAAGEEIVRGSCATGIDLDREQRRSRSQTGLDPGSSHAECGPKLTRLLDAPESGAELEQSPDLRQARQREVVAATQLDRLPHSLGKAIGHVVRRKPWLTSHASYPSCAVLAGIDLGGTQVRVALARSDGNLVASVKTKTPSLGSPQAMVDWAAAEIDKHRGREKVRSITIAAPGPIDLKHGVLVNPPNLPWKNVPLAAMLAKATGAKVQLANDADMAGLGEFHRGAGRGTRNMVYITWSTGVGGGLIIDGKLHRGAHGSAGEVGHIIIDPNGPLDTCGQRGCLEAFIGGANIARETGHSAAELFAAAAKGSKPARIAVERAARYMGLALISLTNVIDPEMFVIGGGISRSWALVEPTIVETLHSSPFIKPARRPRVRRARLGDRAGQVGAVEWARINQ